MAQEKQNEESLSGAHVCVGKRTNPTKSENEGKESKGVRWMPRLTEARKDVVSCEKPRVGANGL